jgi:hypothetical protein
MTLEHRSTGDTSNIGPTIGQMSGNLLGSQELHTINVKGSNKTSPIVQNMVNLGNIPQQ